MLPRKLLTIGRKEVPQKEIDEITTIRDPGDGGIDNAPSPGDHRLGKDQELKLVLLPIFPT